MISDFRKAIARRIARKLKELWVDRRESKSAACQICMGWGEIGHGEENRDCHNCYGGIIRGESWGRILDGFVESALHRVGIHEDEVW